MDTVGMLWRSRSVFSRPCLPFSFQYISSTKTPTFLVLQIRIGRVSTTNSQPGEYSRIDLCQSPKGSPWVTGVLGTDTMSKPFLSAKTRRPWLVPSVSRKCVVLCTVVLARGTGHLCAHMLIMVIRFVDTIMYLLYETFFGCFQGDNTERYRTVHWNNF